MKKVKKTRTSVEIPDGFDLINFETGEVGEANVKQHEYMAGKESFYLTYTFLINALQKDMTIAEIKVFAYLLEHYGAGVSISINKTIKEEMCEKTGLSSINTISNVLSTLQTKEIPMLFKKGRGTFILNPRYAFKGSSKTRDKELMAIIKLGCKNC